MSLESGKNLGFIASIINIVVPVVMGVVLIAFYAVLFSQLFASIQTGITTTPFFAGTVFFAVIGIVIAAGVLALVGYVLFLVAMHRLSQYYSERSVFSNLIRALVIQIVTAVVIAVLVFALLFISYSSIIAGSTTTSPPTGVLSLLGVYAVAGIVGFVVSIYCALLYKRSFDRLAEKSGVDNFRTTGLLYLIGTILNIAGVGSIIVWIGWIFAAMGYRKLQPLPVAPAPFVPPYQTGPAVAKRCSACGVENSSDALYCRNCGRLL